MSFFALCQEIFAKQGGVVPLPTEEQIGKLEKLTQIMLETNKQMNLTAITEESAVILKHYVDSLTVANHIPQGARVIDVGCGAGFPTLPLAIFRPDLRIVALDSTAKRIDYVQKAADALGLTNVTAIAGRAEEFAKKGEYREQFDVATARAVASLPVLAELCLPFVKKDGTFVSMKAARAEEECELAARAVSLCGGALREVRRISLASDGDAPEGRVLVLYDKREATPAKYPRHFSQISKKPL